MDRKKSCMDRLSLSASLTSRGGLKLEKAIEKFGITFDGLKVMDIGSSTGGFCDCALQHGASSIIAIDVGWNLLHESLRSNEREEV